ncbi:TonB-dependent siderophore receptor [Methylomonas sp. MS20]|uniref:TonB-dependent siderophore receptor n=1 Tax=unclassified Methylomonas TaxID=2608980 RepID=UPI0028A38815|nr:TonB-dependent siderophore receptor [Methylomonas sp. MV1]MDT4332349.1 TonB-dependent siderophore receptor [Methylomonas sp. MV1]
MKHARKDSNIGNPCRVELSPLLAAIAALCGSLLVAVPAVGTAAPDSGISQQTMNFDIGAGSLSDALLRFSEISGQRVLFGAELVRGLGSDGLNGRYTPSAALQRLLSGSGLNARQTDSGSITLEKAAEKPLPSGAATMPAVTVLGQATYDSTDPYNPAYSLPNASTATKTDTPIMHTPMSVKVVPQQVLKDQQVVTLDQALRNVSGVVSGDGNDREFYVRGFSSTSSSGSNGGGGSTYYRDGFPFINGWHHTVDLANIDRVEVLKGPGSILFGRSEPGGIINFVTKQPLDTPYYSVRQQFGSYGHFRTDIDATGPLSTHKDLAYRVNFAYQANDSITEWGGGERIFAAPMLRWRISDKTTSTFKLEYSDIKTNADNPVPYNLLGKVPRSRNFNDPWAYSEDQYVMFSANTEHVFNENWTLRHRFNASFAEVTSRNVAAAGSADASGNFGRWGFEQNFDGGDYYNNYFNSLELTGKFETGFAKHTLLIGSDYLKTDARATMGPVFAWMPGFESSNAYQPIHRYQMPGMTVSNFPPQRTAFNTFEYDNPWFGFYAQDQVELPYHVHLLGGLRYDNADTDTYADYGAIPQFFPSVQTPFVEKQSNDRVSPRGGVLWQPIPELSLFGSYTENFGAPNGLNAQGRVLAPQTAAQWEAGVKTELFDGRLITTLTYFDLKKYNLSFQDFPPGSPSQLIGKAESRGLELDISGEILPGWKIMAAYAYMPFAQTVEDPIHTQYVGKRLHNAPENSGNLWTTYEFQNVGLRGLKLGAGVQAVGQRFLGYDETQKTPGYATLNLMASQAWKVGQTRVTAQINADNLLDKTYLQGLNTYGVGTYGAPRTFMGSVRIEY